MNLITDIDQAQVIDRGLDIDIKEKFNITFRHPIVPSRELPLGVLKLWSEQKCREERFVPISFSRILPDQTLTIAVSNQDLLPPNDSFLLLFKEISEVDIEVVLTLDENMDKLIDDVFLILTISEIPPKVLERADNFDKAAELFQQAAQALRIGKILKAGELEAQAYKLIPIRVITEKIPHPLHGMKERLEQIREERKGD